MSHIPAWAEEWVKANMAESIRSRIEALDPFVPQPILEWAAAYDENFPPGFPSTRRYGKRMRFRERVQACIHILTTGVLVDE